jgi:ribosomal protein S18 acetylase RimI-like enzyme
VPNDREAITFRGNVVPADCARVRAIVSSSGFFSPAEVLIAVELVEERLSKGPASGYHFLFAERQGKVLGYSCFGPIPATRASYDLYWIAVCNDCRRMGIGHGLLVRSEAEIVRMGGARVYLETSSRLLYTPTRLFYGAAGYHQEALLEDFYAPGDAKVIYVKALEPLQGRPTKGPCGND